MAILTLQPVRCLRRLRWAALMALSLFTVADELQAATPEYQVKAAYVLNFARYVQWPPDAFPTPTSPLIVAIVGDDPFGSTLDELLRGEEVDGHPLVARRYRHVEEIGDCHILFVGRLGRAERDALLSRLENRSILTVSDSGDFARRGGMILLVAADGRVRMQVNWQAAKRANLSMSSKLLRSAEVVDDERTRG